MTVGQEPVTAEELLRAPEDGPRRELVRGEARIPSEEEGLDGAGVVPGWTLPVSDVFR